MSNINIVMADITSFEVDAIVNAANSGLRMGSGVCGAIFNAAGPRLLQNACDEYRGCPTGSAVITPGFNLKAKHVIHAVGPIWYGGNNNEEDLLYSAYQSSLKLLSDNNLSSIVFPLISSGIYGYPHKKAWEVAIRACNDFLSANTEIDISITFAVIDKALLNMGLECLG